MGSQGDLSPSTTTSSARIELDYDGHDLDGARGDRWSSDGCCGGSSCDASSQRPRSRAVAADGASLVATGGQQCCAGGGPSRSQVGPAVTPHESRAECVSGLARSLAPVGCCVWRLASGEKLATEPDP